MALVPLSGSHVALAAIRDGARGAGFHGVAVPCGSALGVWRQAPTALSAAHRCLHRATGRGWASRTCRPLWSGEAFRAASSSFWQHAAPQQRWASSSSSSGPPEEGDPYKVLGVPRTATTDEIKAAYKKKALEWHPDRHPADKRKEAERRFSAIANAYEVLSDTDKRRQFDHGGVSPGGGFPSSNPYADVTRHWQMNWQTAHSPESAERLFRQVFGRGGINSVLEQLFGGQPFGQEFVIQPGMEVQVLGDQAAVLRACRASGIDTSNDPARRRALGKKGQVIKVDASDQTVKVSIPGVGDVWFAATAVRPAGGRAAAGPSPIGGAFGGFAPGGRFASDAQVHQEVVQLPDGRRVLRVTRSVRKPDGSVVQDVQMMELPGQ